MAGFIFGLQKTNKITRLESKIKFLGEYSGSSKANKVDIKCIKLKHWN